MPKPYKSIKIIHAEDHELMRDGFREMVKKLEGIELVAEASSAEQLMGLIPRFHPDVILMDIKMPGMEGIEATRIITQRHPEVSIIALSMFDTEVFVSEMMLAGAKGFLSKNAGKSEIQEGIETVNRNQYFFCKTTNSNISRKMLKTTEDIRNYSSHPFLNAKEKEVISLICQEKFNKEISVVLGLSVRTIEGYREKILEKLNVKNTAGIVIVAIRSGLFKP